MREKGFSSLIIILGVILIIGILVGTYYLGRVDIKPAPSIQPITENPTQSVATQQPQVPADSDETVNWKTFTSSGISLSFKYPTDCESPKEGVAVISLSCYADKNIDRTWGTVVTNNDLTITINYERNTNNESLDDYLNRTKKTYRTLTDLRDLTIGGQPTKAWKSTNQLVNNDFYHVIYNGSSIDIVKHPVETTKQKEFDQILSTFKFTN